MVEVPYIQDTETVEAQYPQGSGAKVILVYGHTTTTAQLTTIYEFNNYSDAVTSLTTSTGGPLLEAIGKVFEEGQIRSVTDTLGINKVYAINMGTSATYQDYADAQETSKLKKDVDIELYVGQHDVTLMGTTATYLSGLATQGQKRTAVFCTNPAAPVATKALMTDDGEGTYIQDSRIYIKDGLQEKYAAKMACTPYYMDPAKGAYRSVTMDDIDDYQYEDLETLTAAGIICDWEHQSPITQTGRVEPVKAVATSHAKTEQPVDSLAHCRLNADYQFHQRDIIIQGMLKDNDTETGLQTMEQAVKSYFAGEAKKGYLIAKEDEPSDPGYMVQIEPSTTDVYGVVVRTKIRPVNAIYSIEEVSVIQAPV